MLSRRRRRACAQKLHLLIAAERNGKRGREVKIREDSVGYAGDLDP